MSENSEESYGQKARNGIIHGDMAICSLMKKASTNAWKVISMPYCLPTISPDSAIRSSPISNKRRMVFTITTAAPNSTWSVSKLFLKRYQADRKKRRRNKSLNHTKKNYEETPFYTVIGIHIMQLKWQVYNNICPKADG